MYWRIFQSLLFTEWLPRLHLPLKDWLEVSFGKAIMILEVCTWLHGVSSSPLTMVALGCTILKIRTKFYLRNGAGDTKGEILPSGEKLLMQHMVLPTQHKTGVYSPFHHQKASERLSYNTPPLSLIEWSVKLEWPIRPLVRKILGLLVWLLIRALY